MERLPNRQSSFTKSKRVKPESGKASSAISLKWPHSDAFKATPETLSEAGFYWDPSYEERDNVTCFICSKQLSDWDEDDDPFEIHWSKCKTTCAWAIVRCGLKYDFDDEGHFVFQKSRAPNTKAMEKARLQTFTQVGTWPHQDKNHGAHQTKMAQAGFVYTPQHENDDLATCLYCSTSLSGWEDDDDPLDEHRKRVAKHDLDCPFFAAQASSSKPKAKTSKTTASKKRSQSTATTRSRTQSVVASDSDAEAELASVQTSTSIASTANGKPSRATRSKSRAPTDGEPGTSKKKKETRRLTRKASTKSMKSLASEAEQDSDAPSEEAPPKPKRGRPKKSVIKELSEEESEITATQKDVTETPKPKATRATKTPKTATRASSRAISKQKVKRAIEPDLDPSELVPVSQEATRVSPPTKSSKPPPKRKGAVKAPPTPPTEDDEADIVDALAEAEDEVVASIDPADNPPPSPIPPPEEEREDSTLLEPPPSVDSEMHISSEVSSREPSPSPKSAIFHDHGREKQQQSLQQPVIAEVEDAVVEISSDEEAGEDEDAQTVPATPPRSRSSQSLLGKTSASPQRRVDALPAPADAEDSAPDVEMATVEAAASPERQAITSHRKPGVVVTEPSPLTSSEDTLPLQPPLASLPIERVEAMTEVELNMTVEEWIRHEMQIQYDTFKADGERKIQAFRERAKSTRKAIESM